MSGTVGFSNHHMRMYLRLAVFQSDVTDEGDQFRLLFENDRSIVLFSLPIESSELHGRECADGLEAARSKL